MLNIRFRKSSELFRIALTIIEGICCSSEEMELSISGNSTMVPLLPSNRHSVLEVVFGIILVSVKLGYILFPLPVYLAGELIPLVSLSDSRHPA